MRSYVQDFRFSSMNQTLASEYFPFYEASFKFLSSLPFEHWALSFRLLGFPCSSVMEVSSSQILTWCLMEIDVKVVTFP